MALRVLSVLDERHNRYRDQMKARCMNIKIQRYLDPLGCWLSYMETFALATKRQFGGGIPYAYFRYDMSSTLELEVMLCLARVQQDMIFDDKCFLGNCSSTPQLYHTCKLRARSSFQFNLRAMLKAMWSRLSLYSRYMGGLAGGCLSVVLGVLVRIEDSIDRSVRSLDI